MESLLIITGTMGAGKTAVLAEASDLLTGRGIAHAAVDLDALGLGWLPSGNENDTVMYRNLASLCENYAAAGVSRVVLARAIETRQEFERCRSAVSAQEVTTCRLTANIDTMEHRVAARETGILRTRYIARVRELNQILDHARLENFSVGSEGRALTEIAREVLVKAGWKPAE